MKDRYNLLVCSIGCVKMWKASAKSVYCKKLISRGFTIGLRAHCNFRYSRKSRFNGDEIMIHVVMQL